MSEIVYKNSDFVIAYKPAGTPTQKDPSGDSDFVSETAQLLTVQKESDELYLVHRLDRVVGGLLVLARNKETAAYLSSLAAGGELSKEYLAVAEGVAEGGELCDYLYKSAPLSKSFVTDKQRRGAKLAHLEYECLETVKLERGARSLVRITLHTGRFHQIRAQFSSRGLPLVGDNKYGSRDRGANTPALFAYKLNINMNEGIKVQRLPDISTYPWNLFSQESYKKCLT